MSSSFFDKYMLFAIVKAEDEYVEAFLIKKLETLRSSEKRRQLVALAWAPSISEETRLKAPPPIAQKYENKRVKLTIKHEEGPSEEVIALFEPMTQPEQEAFLKDLSQQMYEEMNVGMQYKKQMDAPNPNALRTKNVKIIK